MGKPLPWLNQDDLDRMQAGLREQSAELRAAMAERASQRVSKGTSTYYPWESWTDGQWHDVTRGVDFTCTAASFKSYLYSYAMDHDLYVRTMRVSSTEVAFQFGDKPFPKAWRNSREPLE